MAETSVRDPRERTPDYTTVQMVNEGDREFVGTYTGQQFHAGPGERIFVPYYAMCLWAGHPEALDINRRQRYRTDELKRLQVKYGTHSFGGCWTTDLCDGNGGKHPPMRHLPDVHFYNVENGTEYMTVLVDPEGKRLGTNTLVNASQDSLESKALRDLQSTVERLQSELAVVSRQQGTMSIPPAPEPTIPPAPGSSTIPAQDGDNGASNSSTPGPTTPGPIPVSEDAIAEARSRGSNSTKPRIPPSPGPLQT